VAVELFNERGYDGTSMRHLAARLGIAKSAIYHHVTGKEELLSLALDRALAGLSAVTDRARALPAPAIERLEYLVRGSVDVLEAESPYVTLLLRVHDNTDVERAALDRRRAFDRFVAELVAEAVRDGDIRPEADAMITARLLFGLVNSIVEWYRPGRSAGAASLADAVCAMAFDGLRVRRRPSRLVADRDLAALTVPLRAAGDDDGLAGGDAPRAPGHGRRVQRVGDRGPRHQGDHDAGPAQQFAAQVTSGCGVLAVHQRRARHGAERQLRMHFIQRMPAGQAVPVGLEQLRPQAPGLDAEALAGQLPAALVRGLVAGLRPDRPGRYREDRAAPGPKQAARLPVRFTPARLEQPQRHVDPDHAGAGPVAPLAPLALVEHPGQGLVHANRINADRAESARCRPGHLQADRDPAALATVDSGYPHSATVTHRRGFTACSLR
jgi:AcrR family transcriptional regulator